MNIEYRHLNSKEAWKYILDMYDWYWKNNAVQYGYNILNWIPEWPECAEAFKDKNRNRIESLSKEFESRIYNEKDLAKHDEFIKTNVIPDLISFSNMFGLIVKKQGLKIPESCEIVSAYGGGGSYNNGDNKPRIIARMTGIINQRSIASTIKHEFVHILIQEPIIRKYNIKQDMKEAIVDIICKTYFDKKMQGFEITSFVEKYVNKDSIESSLKLAVEKMMVDYEKMSMGVKNKKEEIK